MDSFCVSLLPLIQLLLVSPEQMNQPYIQADLICHHLVKAFRDSPLPSETYDKQLSQPIHPSSSSASYHVCPER